MNKNIIHVFSRIRLLLLLSFTVMAQTTYSEESGLSYHPDYLGYMERAYEEAIINGIRDFLYTNVAPNVNDDDKIWYYSLRSRGFLLNPEDKNTFIAPDGKVVPRFDGLLCVVGMNKENGTVPPPSYDLDSYSGNIYLPDYVEDFSQVGDFYVLDFSSKAMGDKLVSIRTPIYAPICMEAFRYAVNMQKVQIGACHLVSPYSFMNCAMLETVIFEQAPYVYEEAFVDCIGIKDIVLKSEAELPLLERASVFEECVYNNATVYVPDNLMEAFKSDSVWSRFANVKHLDECTVELVKP